MADLHHLLDELDAPPAADLDQQQQQAASVDGNDVNLEDAGAQEEGDAAAEDTNDDGMLPAQVPLALQDAQLQEGEVGDYTGTVRTSRQEPDRLDLQDLVGGGGVDVDLQGGDNAQQQQAYQQLKSWWIHELQTPELLPWQGELIETWIQKLQQDEEEEQEASNNMPLQLHALLQSVRRVDRQRLQFIVSNLLWTRLQKVERHHTHLLTDKQGDELDVLLGPAERDFLHEYHQLWTRHMHETVTQHFPQNVWKALDEPGTYPQPDLDAFCWVRFLKDTTLQVADSQSQSYEDDEDDDFDMQRYTKGTILVLPYRKAREVLDKREAELFL